MTYIPGGPEDGHKRAYHTPMIQEFGSVSETTATFGSGDDVIPPWLDETPGGGGGGGLS